MKKYFAPLLLTLAALLCFATPAMVGAQSASFDPFKKVCDGSTTDSSVCKDNEDAKANPFNPISGKDGILFTAVRILSSLVGVISVIMILFGSIKYITAGGEANSVASAKRTIVYALVGVLVAALAQGLVIFIVNSLN